MEQQKPKLHPALAALIVIVLVGIVASAVIIVNNSKGSDSTAKTTTTHDHAAHSHESDSTQATVDSTDTSTYKDGTYTATGSYISPSGRESIELTVTIKDGVITDTSLVKNATDREAEEYQTSFADHYSFLIEGKKVAGLSLSRVAGSSLTSNGFNDALDEIRTDAKA